MSTTKAEFVAASEIARRFIGAREMLVEINIAPALPMLMHVDNKTPFKQLEGEASTTKARRIDMRLRVRLR